MCVYHGCQSVTPRVCARACSDSYVRLGVLEDNEWQGEVSLGQTDQVLSEQRFGSTLFLSLTAVQERHHPLEGVFHIALGAGLVIERRLLEDMDMNRCCYCLLCTEICWLKYENDTLLV